MSPITSELLTSSSHVVALVTHLFASTFDKLAVEFSKKAQAKYKRFYNVVLVAYANPVATFQAERSISDGKSLATAARSSTAAVY